MTIIVKKPKALLVERVAGRVRAAKASGGKILAVCGPAVVHTGAAPAVASLVRDGWIDVLFAGTFRSDQGAVLNANWNAPSATVIQPASGLRPWMTRSNTTTTA